MPHRRALVAVEAELQQQLLEVLKGWAVHAVADGEAAIDYLWEGSPDLVVLDFDLPRQSAYDVVRHLAMRRPDLLRHTVVFLDGEATMRAMLEGVDLWAPFEKPVDLPAFAALVEAG